MPGPLAGCEEVELPEAVVRHAVRVLRLSDGDPVVLFDGRGGEAEAVLSRRDGLWCAKLESFADIDRESMLECVLVQALASGDKMDWVIQKAVELGVNAIVPLRADRSVVKLSDDRAAKRLAHWQQVAVAACEQCGRNRVPDVSAPQTLSRYLETSSGDVLCWYFDPLAERPLSGQSHPALPVHVCVGPEAGWSDRELAALRGAGCEAVRLGPRVLRTETAGIAALSAMQALWGDF